MNLRWWKRIGWKRLESGAWLVFSLFYQGYPRFRHEKFGIGDFWEAGAARGVTYGFWIDRLGIA